MHARNIAIVDDHPMLRRGLASFIEQDTNYKIVAQCGDGKEFLLCLADGVVADLVLLDICMPGMNGYDTIRELKTTHPSVKIIALSQLTEENAIANILRLGADKFISKADAPGLLMHAINALFSSHTDGGYQARIARPSVAKNIFFTGKKFELTKKEIEFINYCGQGLSYELISQKMFVSKKTIENYCDQLFEKPEIKNRIDLVLFGIRTGLITLF